MRKGKPLVPNPTRKSECGAYLYLLLACGREAKLDADDYSLVKDYRWVSYLSDGRVYVKARNRGGRGNVYLHRLITGAPTGSVVDHVSRDPLDNTRGNLRVCKQEQNARNQRKRPGSSKWKGVSWASRERKWRAYIVLHGKQTSLGYFSSEDDAATAYNLAAYLMHGEFASYNRANG